MVNKEKRNLQGRREFFKEVAKKALPIIGVVALMSNPIVSNAMQKESMNCDYSCTNSCSGSCTGACTGGCSGCTGSCSGSCSGCTGTCTSTCTSSCHVGCIGGSY